MTQKYYFKYVFIGFFFLVIAKVIIDRPKLYKDEECNSTNNCTENDLVSKKKFLSDLSNSNFNGIILSKYSSCEKKFCDFIIKGVEEKINLGLENHYSCLCKMAEIGDSLIKIPQETKFMLKKKYGMVIKFDYECGLCCGCEDFVFPDKHTIR